MKIKKEPIREDRYLNLKLDTYPVDFTVLDSLFYDLTQFTYCIVMNDGTKDIFLEYASSKPDALFKHKEYYDRMLLRPTQWFDVKNRKFKYVTYIDGDVEEKLSDVKAIKSKDLYQSFIQDAQQVVINGSNNGLTFYTKREATAYSRKITFSIFSGLRVKIGQLKNTSYAELHQSDIRAVDVFVRSTDVELAKRFLNEIYDSKSEEHEKWEMFVDLIEAKIAEYFREGNRSTKDAPNYIILAKLVKEIDERIALTRKPASDIHTSDGPAYAEYEKRVKENVVGKFYVDDKCIVCDACAGTAPNFFKLNEQTAFVTAQPMTPEEIELCNKALKGCPVSAIGSDGDVKSSVASAVVTEVKPIILEVKEKDTNPNTADIEDNKIVDNAKPEKAKELVNSVEEFDIQSMKSLLDLVPIDKLAEIKALIQSSSVIHEEAQALPEVNSEVVTPSVEVAPLQSNAKPLPAKSPDGSTVYPENVAGMFYVDDKCIECDACVGVAPNSFVIEDGHAYVFAQPLNDKEIAECKEAMAGCPVGSININE